MIKFSYRRNLIYPFQLILWNGLRDIDNALIIYFFAFDNSLIFTFLIFLGIFFAGLILYLYQKLFIEKKKKIKSHNFLLIEFTKTRNNLSKDSKKKIYFLLITSAIFDFIQFFLSLQLSKFITLSYSLNKD